MTKDDTQKILKKLKEHDEKWEESNKRWKENDKKWDNAEKQFKSHEYRLDKLTEMLLEDRKSHKRFEARVDARFRKMDEKLDAIIYMFEDFRESNIVLNRIVDRHEVDINKLKQTVGI